MKRSTSKGAVKKTATNSKVEPTQNGIRASIHLLHIPDREARKRALQVLIDTNEMWLSLIGDKYGLSTAQVDALRRAKVPFICVSKTIADGQAD
ncbi:MAG: hypothetical protein L0215_21465 [Gemmataceae bacterium]|nr:hypothetical protein [Gemmataceae bacterium]